jgi:hypothetical protein
VNFTKNIFHFFSFSSKHHAYARHIRVIKFFFMELLMETKLNFLSLLLMILVFSACGGEKTIQEQTGSLLGARPSFTADNTSKPPALNGVSGDAEMALLLRSLDEMAELERGGSWIQGIALAESGIRENAGDFAGAVAAAYKEFSFAYGMGLIQKADIVNGLLNLLNSNSEETVTKTTHVILAFLEERWDEAAPILVSLFDELDEPDGFGRWMRLVCALEISIRDQGKTDLESETTTREVRRATAAYRSIRARYASFPEYWYRGARAFSGAIAADYAENCINLSPQGPFAAECRKILASYAGLRIEDGLSIRTKREIESIITLSVNSGNPQVLDNLLPLIGLPENPYTVYAVSALRSIINIQGFRDYFNRQAAASSGRLAERLLYICRG